MGSDPFEIIIKSYSYNNFPSARLHPHHFNSLGARTMTPYPSAPPKFSLFVAVAFLALQATPAEPADSGSGTFVQGTSRSATYKDVYAFRAEDSGKKPVTVVILSTSPMDKKAMTAALRKEKKVTALRMGPFLDDMAYALIEVAQNGEFRSLYFFTPPGSNLSLSGSGTSEVKVNTAKRVEGRFSMEDKSMSGETRKIDLRFATDLADVGPSVRN